VSQYCALDQYAMGLRLPSEVPPMFVVRAPSNGTPSDPPRIGVEFRGTRKDVRIEDIIAAMGPRQPSAATAQKAFRAAFLFVVSQGSREASTDLDKLERIRTAWETYFSDSTGRRGSMSMRLR
jgi:hypothetical protein